ncbi:MAG: hypothetical protein AMS22_09840 [Thiotrichales bacterium SG8_50]|nr:MAG: hypothetical protein AMS22_09840 [Thiotrichales bacterium SG8_50]
MYSYYGTITEANEYFSYRLHEEAWSDASTADREKALIRATAIIDALNFKGQKATVYDEENYGEGYEEDLRAAQVSQELEFPRDEDTDVPHEIKVACWEIAYNLLDGVDPDLELENLGVVSQGIASVRTTYNRNHTQIEHLMNGVPSAAAWRYLRPFLRSSEDVRVSRAD